MRLRALYIPYLLTFASLLQLNHVASLVVSPEQLIRPLLILWLLLFLLSWPAFWFTRDWDWASLLLAVFAMGFYFSASFFTSVALFIIIGVVILLGFARLRRMQIRLAHFLVILTGTGILFMVYVIFLMSTTLSQIPWADYEQAISSAKNFSLENLSSPSVKPDVYYIVIDGYARADILQEMFNFDNSEFITKLEEQGFIVPGSNHSNYPSTPLSIASTLNMDYIQSLSPALDEQYQRWLMAPFIDHSRVRALLESQGYKTVSISTNWTITDNPTTDIYFHPFPVLLTDFEGFILDMTPLQGFEPILRSFASIPTAESHRKIIHFNFETLADMPHIPGPKFVFAHIISPHPPFVFDSDGTPLDTSYPFTFQDANEFSGSSSEYSQRYVEQVQFVNDELQDIIDEILAQSETPPIIILQADHGSGMRTDLTSPRNTCIRERFSPFAAYYLPGADADIIPADISNVNIFRILFNEYFNADLPLLENRQYFYKGTLTYYEFEDVTERLNDKCNVP